MKKKARRHWVPKNPTSNQFSDCAGLEHPEYISQTNSKRLVELLRLTPYGSPLPSPRTFTFPRIRDDSSSEHTGGNNEVDANTNQIDNSVHHDPNTSSELNATENPSSDSSPSNHSPSSPTSTGDLWNSPDFWDSEFNHTECQSKKGYNNLPKPRRLTPPGSRVHSPLPSPRERDQSFSSIEEIITSDGKTLRLCPYGANCKGAPPPMGDGCCKNHHG